jgi:hypothetical protein
LNALIEEAQVLAEIYFVRWEAMARGSIRTAPPRETRFVPVMPDILPQCGERLPAESGKLA